jgi:hypothetical protein
MQIIQLLIQKHGVRKLAEQWRAKGQSLETTYCLIFGRHEPVGRVIARNRDDQTALFAKAHATYQRQA